MTTDKAIGLLGIGLFLCLMLQGISSIISIIIEDVLLITNLSPLITYGLSVYLTLILVLMVFVSFLKVVKRIDFNQSHLIKKIFWSLVIAYTLTQLLSFAQPLVSNLYRTREFLEIKVSYQMSIRESSTFQIFAIDLPVMLLKYLIIIYLFIKGMKSLNRNQVQLRH